MLERSNGLVATHICKIRKIFLHLLCFDKTKLQYSNLFIVLSLGSDIILKV